MNNHKGKTTKTILLTGASGFLGSNLLLRLLTDGYEVIILKRSFSNTHRIDAQLSRVRYYDIDRVAIPICFEENKIDIVIHCATNYGRNNIDPLQIIDANLILPLKLLEIGGKYGLRCFINTDTLLDKGINSYALSKKQFLDWLKGYSKQMTCVNIALEHFYGPLDDRSKFISFIINELLAGKPVINLTPGEQKRDFIYIDDVIDAFLAIVTSMERSTNGFYRYEIGTSQFETIKEVVNLLKKLSGNRVTDLNYGAMPYRRNEVLIPNIDTSAVRRLGWRAKTKLSDGLSLTLKKEKEARGL